MKNIEVSNETFKLLIHGACGEILKGVTIKPLKAPLKGVNLMLLKESN